MEPFQRQALLRWPALPAGMGAPLGAHGGALLPHQQPFCNRRANGPVSYMSSLQRYLRDPTVQIHTASTEHALWVRGGTHELQEGITAACSSQICLSKTAVIRSCRRGRFGLSDHKLEQLRMADRKTAIHGRHCNHESNRSAPDAAAPGPRRSRRPVARPCCNNSARAAAFPLPQSLSRKAVHPRPLLPRLAVRGSLRRLGLLPRLPIRGCRSCRISAAADWTVQLHAGWRGRRQGGSASWQRS